MPTKPEAAVSADASAAPDACLICGAARSGQLYAATPEPPETVGPQHFLAGRSAAGHGRIVRCDACGFAFTSPRLTAARYAAIYDKVASGRRLSIPAEAAAHRRQARLAQMVRSFAPGSHFVDFGCGDGGFLAAYGHDGVGFEPRATAQALATGAPILQGDWRTVAGGPSLPPGSVEFAVAFDVIEHLPSLRQDLAGLFAVLRPGGRLFLTMPNIESRTARLMGRRWSMLLHEHLWYFAPSTIRRLLEHCGFSDVEISPFPYATSMGQLATRAVQTLSPRSTVRLPVALDMGLTLPAGVMFVACRRSERSEETT